MRKLICWLLCLCCLSARAQQITAAEYFIDNDPGAGNATPVAVGASSSDVSFTAAIATAGLQEGFHFLGLRTRSDDGRWGLTEIRGFFISNQITSTPAIVAGEYFIDSDPGAGNAVPINIGSGGSDINFVLPISANGLNEGFHFLAIRTKDADGRWALFESRGFYITALAVDAGAVVAAEAFIDTDPGVGNGLPLSTGTSGTSVTFVTNIPTGLLAPGFHWLTIRAKDADGKWGLMENRGFYVSPSATNVGALVSGEYFLDSDPGVGNGQPFTFSTTDHNINEVIPMQIPTGISQGNHLLVARVKDVNGVWSLFDTVRTITVSGVLPLDFLQFSARRKESKVVADWITENEINTSHFEVERSKNGIAFSKIGEVTARNAAGRHTYTLEDAQPLKGLNYYRLKQVDQYGTFKYSTIVKIFFGDAGMNELKLFPQPVQSTLNVIFGGSGNNVFIQVYDAGGKMVLNERRQNNSVLNISTNGLSNGTYWIVVSDGITQQRGQFIKQ